MTDVLAVNASQPDIRVRGRGGEWWLRETRWWQLDILGSPFEFLLCYWIPWIRCIRGAVAVGGHARWEETLMNVWRSRSLAEVEQISNWRSKTTPTLSVWHRPTFFVVSRHDKIRSDQIRFQYRLDSSTTTLQYFIPQVSAITTSRSPEGGKYAGSDVRQGAGSGPK